MENPIKTILPRGIDGVVVDVECSLSNGLPAIVIVGLGNKIIEESKERIRSAFLNSKLALPRKRIVINLAPADVPKTSPSLDLAIALAIFRNQATVDIPQTSSAFIGELGLDGSIRPVRGLIGMLVAGRRQGITHFFIPAQNITQAQLVPGISATPLRKLTDLLDISTGSTAPSSMNNHVAHSVSTSVHSIDAIVGQGTAKRALCIAAAGGHNILFYGSPGTGKSMLAKALHCLLPPLDTNEMLEITQLHSLVTKDYEKIVTERPVRTPHHSASQVAIIGGGNQIRPGEVSLSHLGVLLLDEMPEYSRATLEALRQPLEDRIITVSRANDSITFPADFILAATANPCPCGYHGTQKECTCTMLQIKKYQQKISGPILDRIDLHVAVNQIDYRRLFSKHSGNSGQKLYRQVQVARQKQQERYGKKLLNAQLSNTELRLYVQLDGSAKNFLDRAAEQLEISARSYMRTLKLARTIADLDDNNLVTTSHLAEALQFRKQLGSSSP